MLQVCGHIKHVVVLVALHSCHHFTCCQLFPHINFSPVCEFLADFVDSHTAKTGLLRCCLYKKSQGTSSGTTLASTRSTNLDSVVWKRGSVLVNDGDSGSQPTPMEIGAVMSTCACCDKAGHEKARCRFRKAKCSNKTGHLRAMCRQCEKSAVPRAAVAKAVRAVQAQTSAIVADRSVIDDLIALVETRVAASVASVVI